MIRALNGRIGFLAMLRAVAEARAVRRRSQALLKLNLELAQLEGKEKATTAAIAGVFGVVAVILVMYAVGFVFAAIAAALGLRLPLWGALLLVAAAMILCAAIAGLLMVHFARGAWPPKPSQAIEEGERTLETVKSHV
jgi:putative superfamily III holin-X